MRYEVGLCIQTGEIVWVYGGKPCGRFSDLKLARHRYIDLVDPAEMTLADDGYADPEYFIYPNARPNLRHEIKRIMARHESVNSRLKAFHVLSGTFRHDLKKHHLCFYAVANMVQLMLCHGGDPLYDVDA